MLARTLILAIAGATLLGACSRSEPPPPPKAQSVAPKPAPIAAPSAAAEIDEGLKDRLARQDAAARMFEKNVLQPPAPRVPEPPPPSVKAAQPPAPAAPSPAPAQPPATRPEPARPEAPRSEPAKVAARSEPPKAASSATPQAAPQPASAQAPASRTEVAAARPAPAPESTAARLLNRVDPDFPREAIQAGVEQGNVRARMTLDAGGNVTRVEIVDATPRRVFDRAVTRALSQWRYSDGPAGRTVDMEVAFKR